MAQRLILGFALAVLAAHLLLLQWVHDAWQEPSKLKPLATPFFTRELRNSPPATIAKPNSTPKQAVAHTPRASTAINTIAKSASLGEDASSIGGDVPPEITLAGSSEPPPQPVAVPAAVPAPNATASAALATSAEPAAPAAPALGDWPADTRLSYALSGNYRGPITGEATVQWQRQGTQYQSQVAMNLGFLFSFTMTSQGQVTSAGLRPTAYEERRTGGKALQLRMDGQGISLNDGQRVEHPAEAQDTASQFVELSHRFAQGLAPLEVGKAVQMWLARPNAVALWTYDIVGQETLNSARLGPIETFHLKPRPLQNPTGSITAEIWFAPALQHLPVRIKITLGVDTWVDLMIEKIEQGQSGPTPPP